MIENKHDWTGEDCVFCGDGCRLCYRSIPTGTGKAEHARKHVREGTARRIGYGTKELPYRYVILVNDPHQPRATSPLDECDGSGICPDCGESMRFNVPRLGPSGGYIHTRTGSLLCACKVCGSAKRSALGTHCIDCFSPTPNTIVTKTSQPKEENHE